VRYLEELRDPALAGALVARIRARMTRPWSLMEVCGGQTHTLARYGLEALLPEGLSIVHGPGCPVCVTPAAMVDRAIALACTPGVVLHTYGDMLRVPALQGDLLAARSRGGEVRVVLSPLEAVDAARLEPARRHVFFAVGFETTAPATAVAIELADALGLASFSVLAAHVRVPPVLELLFSDPRTRVDGLLAAGHVCTVMGTSEYEPIAARHRLPIVVTGFEPLDLLDALPVGRWGGTVSPGPWERLVCRLPPPAVRRGGSTGAHIVSLGNMSLMQLTRTVVGLKVIVSDRRTS
jgi:hydrogenase expression/formation protein HypD